MLHSSPQTLTTTLVSHCSISVINPDLHMRTPRLSEVSSSALATGRRRGWV